jgi:hypothetical protein
MDTLIEPPEFAFGDKAVFKYTNRWPGRTMFSKEVGLVVAVRYVEPFYEFLLEGECVDGGRWYRQTELDVWKEPKEIIIEKCKVVEDEHAAPLAKALQENETLKSEIEASQEKINTLFLKLENYETVRDRIVRQREQIERLEDAAE